MKVAAPPHAPFKREIELDFIRGLAILLVIDFHASHQIFLVPFQWLGFPNFGWIGVDIFFVLSGFLVGGLLVKEWKVRGRIDSKRFLIRRGLKIWPQYYVYLFLILLTGHRSLHALWGNLLNIQNYTGGIAHTWSLAVEEHAYLLLVLCLAIAARRRTRMRHLLYFLLAVIAVVIALQFIVSFHGGQAFATTHTRIDGILEGVILAMIYHYVPDTFRRLQQYRWAWVLVLVAGFLFLRFQPPGKFWSPPLTWDIANAIGIALMMLLYHHREGRRRPALYRFIAWIGLYSYGIYLWHVSVASYVDVAARHLPASFQIPWETLATPIGGILLGVIFTKVVEFPALKLRDRLFPRRVDSAVGTPASIEERAPHTRCSVEPGVRGTIR